MVVVGRRSEKEETVEKKHTLLYKGATRHPFILSIRDGTVDLSSFKRWLGQDYLFVRNLVPFVADVLQKSSKDDKDGDMEVVLGGITSLSDELTWFKNEASKWDVMLHGIAPQKTNQDYCRFLESLMSTEVDYTVAITAFWAIETVYQKSFAFCLEDGSKTPAELIDTCQRWGNEGFGRYCQTLQGIANGCLEKATDDIRSKAEATFIRVLEFEIEFWNMSQGRD